MRLQMVIFLYNGLLLCSHTSITFTLLCHMAKGWKAWFVIVQSSRKVSTNACKVTSGHTYERLQVMFFLLHLWSAIVCMCGRLQVISYFFRNFWTAIICTYKWLQAMFYFICGVQLFVHANDCKSSHILFLKFWTAIICMYERLQAVYLFKKSWSAIICTCKQLEVISYFIFWICGLQLFARTNDCKPCF